MKRWLGVLLSLFALPALSANWYVSSTGSDSNSGTSTGSPFATFTKGMNSMSAGDTLYCTGTFTQQIVVGPANVNKSGTSGNPYTIQALSPGACTITNVGSTKIAIFFSSVAYWVINGINETGGQFVPFANTNSAIHCLASSFAAGGAPNIQTWVGIENSNHITIENGNFKYATGYFGVYIHGLYLANGNPIQTNTAGELNGHSSYITIQNNSFTGLGNLLEQTAVCGDIIDIYNSTNITDHVLIANNNFSLASHNHIEIYGGTSIIQNNLLDNSWASLYGPLKFGVFAGYRTMENNGSNNVLTGNLLKNAGANADPSDHMPPLADMHGSQNLYRRNIFYNSVGNGVNTDCGYGGLDTVNQNYYVHNDIVDVNSQAISYAAYSGDPCIIDGNHVWANNIIKDDRQSPNSGAGTIIQEDADIVHNLAGATGGFVNVGLGPIGQITYFGNIFAPSLTLPNVVAARPASIYNIGTSGQVPMCLFMTGGTGCPNTVTAAATFPTYILGSNIDAGSTPSQRPVFVVTPTPTTAVYGNFALQASSPGINQGVCLTTSTASATATTTIPVANAHYFSTGLGLVPGDIIETCTHETSAQITAITYGTYPAGTLTVSTPLTFNNGEGITYQFTGTAPTIGAIEYGGAPGGPPNVQPKSWTPAVCPSNGRIYSDPTQCPP